MALRHLIIVEGNDDQHVVRNLLIQHQLPAVLYEGRLDSNEASSIIIQKMDSVSKLFDHLPVALKALSDLENLGIIVDADLNVQSRWDALTSALRRTGVVVMPNRPTPEGTIVTLDQGDRRIKIGLWIMPDNSMPGMIEDFLRLLVPQHDMLLLEHAEQSMDGIPTTHRHFSNEHRSKAHIHTWLAWQEEPGKPLGQALTAHYCDPTASHAQIFIDWIRRLFSDEVLRH